MQLSIYYFILLKKLNYSLYLKIHFFTTIVIVHLYLTINQNKRFLIFCLSFRTFRETDGKMRIHQLKHGPDNLTYKL